MEKVLKIASSQKWLAKVGMVLATAPLSLAVGLIVKGGVLSCCQVFARKQCLEALAVRRSWDSQM